MKLNKKVHNRNKRILSIRKNINGTLEMPRASVSRSNKHIYVQIINDKDGETLASASDTKLESNKLKPLENAHEIGKAAGYAAINKNIKKVVFDRRGYKYHGRIKALAEGMREAGLVF